jgi:hypothetical protein
MPQDNRRRRNRATRSDGSSRLPISKSGNLDAMTRKDKLTLFLSIVALIVSMGTFARNEWKDIQRRQSEARQKIILSYRLGHELGAMSTTMNVHALVAKPVPSNVSSFAWASIQSLIDQLSLRLPIKEMNSQDSLMALQHTIYARLLDTYGKEAAELHQLGIKVGTAYAFVWWSDEPSGKVITDYPEFSDIVRNTNQQLGMLQIANQLVVPRPFRKDEMMKSIEEVDESVFSHWR